MTSAPPGTITGRTDQEDGGTLAHAEVVAPKAPEKITPKATAPARTEMAVLPEARVPSESEASPKT